MAKEQKPKEPDKEPKGDAPYQTAHGPIPAENWDNDQRYTDDVDTSPGSDYDKIFGPGTPYDKKKPAPKK